MERNEPLAPENGVRERRGIQSIEVGGALLAALEAHGAPMMLRDLAAAASMSPAKAHPYLVSFGKLGLVEQDPLTGRYKLGPFALRLGLTALQGLNPLRAAVEVAARLADETEQNVAIAVWGNVGATVVAIEESARAIHVNMRPGTVMGLLTTATGRVFAAYLPARLTRPLIERELERLSGGREPLRLSRSFVNETLEEVRRHGMARVLGHPIPGINAFSAPVFDAFGHLTLALTMLGPESRFDASWEGPLAQAMRRAVADITARIGGKPPQAEETAGAVPSKEPAA